MQTNRKYKDSLFTTLFSEKVKLIELYNAVTGKDYGADTVIEINTLENVLYMERKNDISFTIDGKFVVLLEHQSAVNQNMPLRFLMYIARVYEKLVDNRAVYKSSLIKIPTPEFLVLYNGTAEYPEEHILKLSDAFIVDDTKLELEAKVININYGKSKDVLLRSRTLNEYSYFIFKVGQYRKQGIELAQAIEQAVLDCIDEDVLGEFLKSNSSEVVNMLFTEFNIEDAQKVWYEEGREEGREAGRIEGEKNAKQSIAYRLLDHLDIQEVSKATGLPIEEIKKLRGM